MLDIRFVRENADTVKAAMKNRHADVDVDAVLALDARRREIVSEAEVLKAERNTISKSIGLMIKEGKDPEKVKAQVREMGDTAPTHAHRTETTQPAFHASRNKFVHALF